MFYIMLFYVLETYIDKVWMCAEASHTLNKVEFHAIYFSKWIMDLTGIAHGRWD